MKIVLTSYFEPEYHGNGRKIGISPSKPKNLMEEYGYDCDLWYPGITPDKIYWDYHADKKKILNLNDKDIMKEEFAKLSKKFEIEYQKILDSFYDEVQMVVKNSKKSVYDVVELMEEDTLLSWERTDNVSYRDQLSICLEKLGYVIDKI